VNVQILHGPNLNLLGVREPSVYGTLTLREIDDRIAAHARAAGIEVRSAQANGEGEMVDLIQATRGWAEAIVINPAAYTHTSVAIRDTLQAVALPAVAVHLSNPATREWFRQTDIVAGACRGVIAGFGWRSYLMALDALVQNDGV
jgi:3-dehydroquinate dehydratase-2